MTELPLHCVANGFVGQRLLFRYWWRDVHDRFDLYLSEAVLQEIRSGDSEAATRRVELVKNLPVLHLNDDVRRLVHEYDQRLGLAGGGRADLPRFAFSVAYELDYLVTWNCHHIANGEIIRRLLDANTELNLFTPLIVTPEEILAAPDEDET